MEEIGIGVPVFSRAGSEPVLVDYEFIFVPTYTEIHRINKLRNMFNVMSQLDPLLHEMTFEYRNVNDDEWSPCFVTKKSVAESLGVDYDTLGDEFDISSDDLSALEEGAFIDIENLNTHPYQCMLSVQHDSILISGDQNFSSRLHSMRITFSEIEHLLEDKPCTLTNAQ